MITLTLAGGEQQIYNGTVFMKLKYLFLILFISSCGSSEYETIGSGYKLYYGHHMRDLADSRDQLMFRDIWGYKQNDSFILAYRKIPEWENMFLSEDYDWHRMHPNDSLQYWIIRISIDSAYGPFTFNEYEIQKTLLRVDSSLVLKVGIDSISRY